MGVISIEIHPSYDSLRLLVTNKLLRLGNSIKRDISRIIFLSNQNSSAKTYEYMFNCKARIFKRLESIADIRNTTKSQADSWNKVLEYTLSRVYKHSDSEQIHALLHSLIQSDQADISVT